VNKLWGKYMKSLYKHNFTDLSEEIFDIILEKENFYVERIISFGQRTPDGVWLRQERAELVFLLKGWAKLKFKDKGEDCLMQPGDYVLIKSNEEHRVSETAPNEETIWLAIHFKE